MGSPSDAFGLLKMGNSVTPKRQKGKRYLPIQCGRLARGMGCAGWRGKPGGRTAGGWAGVHLYDAEQAAAEPGRAPAVPVMRGKCGFFGTAAAVFPSFVLSAESINTARTPVVPECGKTGVYNTILFGVLQLFVPPGRAVKRFWEKKMIARQFRGFTVAACLMVLAAFGMPDTSWAWESDGPRFNIYTQGYEKADVDEGGSYSKTETGVSAGYKWFTLAYKRSDFSWSHSDSVNFSKKGSPWDQLNKLTLDASFNGALGESVNWFAGGSIISGFEDQIWDSFTFAPRGGLTFSPTYDLKFHVGAAGLISPVRPLVMPIVGAEWRNEHDYGLSGIIGFPGTRVQYRFNDLLAARVAAKWDRDIYRLSNDSSVAGKGYVEESGYTGGAYLDITPLADLKLTVGAELLFDRQLRLYDKGGDEFSKTDVDRALGAVLRASYSF